MSHSDNPLDLKKLARELSASVPAFASADVEARLRSACRARRSRQRLHYWQWAAATALAACLLLVLGWRSYMNRHLQVVPVPSYTGFLALPYAQSDVPIERTIVVPVELGPGDLKALGLPSRFINSRERRRAELLVGQDGVARAVRMSQ